MEPGDLVEFKDGLFGIDAPRNLGIVLERRTRGSERVLVVMTVKGRREVKGDRLGSFHLQTDLDGSEDDRTLRERLDDLTGEVEKARSTPPTSMTDRELWEAVPDEPRTPREMAKAFYDLDLPTADHTSQVQEALDACGDGYGYFRRDGRRWKPLDEDTVARARDGVRALHRLRNALVRVEEVEGEDDDEPETVVRPVPDPDLGQEEQATLDLVARHMRDFLLHDTDRGTVGLGGTEVRAIDGTSIHGFLVDLARDATGQDGVTISSTFARLLLDRGLEDVESLYELVVRRWVKKSPFDWELPDAAVRAADRLDPYEHDPDREDLRDLETYTIDPPDAEDFDDAISLTDDALWVHIADVSRYVRPGTTLDTEAGRRGTSVYLPTRVLPMLPHRLADDLCSLRAGDDRPAVSVRLPRDGGEPTFHRATVHVDENLAYPQVEGWIEEGREPFASMHDLAEQWSSEREGLDLDTGEVRVALTTEGVETKTKRATPATRLIEAFMVAANEAVAETLAEQDVALPYRCHPLPERRAAETFNGQAEVLGLDVRIELPELEDDAGDEGGEELLEALKEGGKLEMGFTGSSATDDEDDDEEEDEPGPARKGLAQLDAETRRAWLEPFQRALDEVDTIEDDDVRQVAHGKLLACLGRAVYTADNVGHFGLGSTRYVHFTSPIRRYPDLLVHRQLKATLRGEDPPYDRAELEPRCERSTDHAIEAERLEWGLKDVALVFRSLDDDEDVRTGIVNGVTAGGAFLTLDDGLEARIGARDLPRGPLEVDDHDAVLRTEDGEPVLQLGQRLAVRLAGRDLAEGKIACEPEHLGRGPDG